MNGLDNETLRPGGGAVASTVGMERQATIPPLPTPDEALSAFGLREAGLRHIRDLGARTWTDHNLHDPGITAHETLCYALTDIAYRTGFALEDLLAEPPSESDPKPQFFTAREIFTCHPLTARDLQKLIIDRPGVKYAWIENAASAEIPLYLDRDKGELTTQEPPQDPEPIAIKGLYHVYLELDRDLELGDLNDPVVDWLLVLPPAAREIRLPIVVHFAMESDWSLDAAEYKDLDRLETAFLTLPGLEAADGGGTLTARVKLSYQDAGGAPRSLEWQASIASPSQDLGPLRDRIRAVLLADQGACLADIVGEHLRKMRKRRDIVADVLCQLGHWRSLCEDVFAPIHGMKVEEVGLCADIEVQGDTDIETVMAEMLFRIDTFLSPEVRFQSLEERREQGLAPDEIYNGPRLDHGFIADEDLDAYALQDEIHASDLIRIIMGIEGVVAVQDLLMTSYLDGEIQTEAARWRLPLSGDRQRIPRLSAVKSKVTFYKGLIPFYPRHAEVDRLRDELMAKRRGAKLAKDVYDMPIPGGSYRNPSAYTSIQHHFPLTYGIGPDGLGPEAGADRKAKARQFKAYLTIFDQFLANCAAQLAWVKDYLSVGRRPDHSYHTQPLEDAPGLPALIEGFVHGPGAGLDLDRPAEYRSAWKAYRGGTYREALQTLAEDEPLRQRRENAFLDHLLARFNEQLGNYGMLMHRLLGGGRDTPADTYRKVASQSPIDTKWHFLNSYPETSYERGKGLSCCAPEVEGVKPEFHWTVAEASGLERRVARLIGAGLVPREAPDDPIPVRSERRNLSYTTFRHIQLFQTATNKWKFRVWFGDGRRALNGRDSFNNRAAAKAAADKLRVFGIDETRYRLVPEEGGILRLLDDQDRWVAKAPRPMTPKAFRDARRRLLSLFRRLRDDPVLDCVDFFATSNVKFRYRITIATSAGEVRIAPAKSFDSEDAARAAIDPLLDLALQEELSRIRTDGEGRFGIEFLQHDGKAVAAVRPRFDTEAEAEAVRRELLTLLEDKFYPEGLHVVEHLLLRPMTKNSPLMNITVSEDCEPPAACLDPYSFRISVILPAWPRRFRDVALRAHIERTIRMEAPAHVAIRICWVDLEQMRAFEDAYRLWLLAKRQEVPSLREKDAWLDTLLKEMRALRSVYPEAILHDCRSDEDGSPVVLGLTSLGDLEVHRN